MIRKALLKDLPYMQNLAYFLNEAMANLEPYYVFPADGDLEEIRYYIEDQASISFVAIEDNLVIGMILATIETTPKIPIFKEKIYVNIIDLIIHPGYQNLGHGKDLIEAVENWAIYKGADFINLSVLEKNKSGTSFYENLSYEPYAIELRKKLK